LIEVVNGNAIGLARGKHQHKNNKINIQNKTNRYAFK